ncbi:MAG: GNAT family N-acetyltransferase [Catenulispora sp.]|nr:GNAT family N-acetyltransferase [Catenulispora sp.]
MTIQAHTLDPGLPQTITDLLPLLQTALAADAPGYPRPTGDYLRLISGPRPTQHRAFLALFDGATPIGYSGLALDFETNRDMCWGDVSIAPEHRADATVPLLDAATAHARRQGAERLVLAITESAPGYEPIFAGRGGVKVDVQRRAQLDLKTIDRDRYAAWAAPSEKNAHYRVETWVAPTPERVMPALEQAGVAMRDAPTGDLAFEPRAPNVERRRKTERRLVELGVRRHIIAAFTDDGTVAGFHDLYVVPGYRMAETGETGVPAAFRGHGLGLRLKADLTLRLLETEPDIDTIGTWNNTDNGPMLRVNDALGYRTAELWNLWQFEV